MMTGIFERARRSRHDDVWAALFQRLAHLAPVSCERDAKALPAEVFGEQAAQFGVVVDD
jgi:hypothetical protein